jgi:formyl-CoA transferase
VIAGGADNILEKTEFYRSARTDLTGPLHGVRVLEATTAWAGPMAGCLLADLGAEVIKIEHPDGEITRVLGPPVPGDSELSLMNETANRNKRSLSLNMREPEGRELVLALAKTADVFLENFKPGTLAGWQLGYEHVKAVKPDIVYTSVSGFGQYGPHHQRAGYDPLVQAQSGWMSLNGEIDGGPIKAPTFLGDDLGGIYGALAALAALRHRDVTGEGQHVDVCLLDAILGASNMFPSLARLGQTFARTGNQFAITAPFNVYECRDGYVFLGMSLDSHWQKLLGLMGQSALADDARYATTQSRLEHREAVDALVAAWCCEQQQADVVALLSEAGLPVAPVNDFHDSVADPHIDERGMLQEVELSDGSRVPLLGSVPKFSRTPTAIRSAAPRLGQDNTALLRELGVDAARQRDLEARGVL